MPSLVVTTNLGVISLYGRAQQDRPVMSQVLSGAVLGLRAPAAADYPTRYSGPVDESVIQGIAGFPTEILLSRA